MSLVLTYVDLSYGVPIVAVDFVVTIDSSSATVSCCKELEIKMWGI